MTDMAAACEIASGVTLLSTIDCFTKRCLGALLLGAGLMTAAPAYADQSVTATDNGAVDCDASKQDLTRISLKDDQFASVSKVTTGVATEDFGIVNEPTRGDIYISVPEGYTRPTISFFGTTQKGFVYKFVCKVSGSEAKQVFVTNADMARPAKPQAGSAAIRPNVPLDQQAVSLVRAMFEQKPLDGFEIRDEPRTPVNVGNLKVQLISEYDGLSMAGKVLRIENTGKEPMVVTDELIASQGAIAVSISNASLQPGQATGAYVVVPAGDL
ncbi:type-F conjugative transfer system secretin TraK [Novosphingobium sp. JCM 18896]|uniref:type-F conjugative transfer system secretin TraK n=1 Tax=Novosphingobium sp. JCM 18896 TaxID=2989731 RepID=UPI0022236ADE|nr:type-F conjugative transfer system secretin TraK [Novosphingobium sp. JCM 18896]MCW1432143.1 type-F conjugative transfer system secretin TraK [Novosphingobium sp. JCM 18896]